MPTPFILVLYYSRYGATKQMAEYICRGVDSIEGIESRLRTVPSVSTVAEATEDSIPSEGPAYIEKQDLIDCSGLALGSPTRFGNMAAPMKYFWDTTSDLWLSGALIDKPAGVFTSSATMHGGQESTLLTMMIPLMHHGAIITGVPYSIPELNHTTSGGTPYGPSHVAGAKSDNPVTDDEKNLCIALGKRLAEIVLKLR